MERYYCKKDVSNCRVEQKRPQIELDLRDATATAERVFSAMNIIKTEPRNKMNHDCMNNSMICYIERDLFASIEDEKTLKHFQGLRNRKINCHARARGVYCFSTFHFIMLA
jgi:hypothetical protein